MGVLGNGVDDDGDGRIDESDEVNFERDWTVRLVLTANEIPPRLPLRGQRPDHRQRAAVGPQAGRPTIQPEASWRLYSIADPARPRSSPCATSSTPTPRSATARATGRSRVYDPVLARTG